MSLIHAGHIVEVFNACFLRLERTRLIGGASEPFYQPWCHSRFCNGIAEIRFRADYLRSALHETAHWCQAGKARRQLPDYGYWYTPDNRNADQQSAFFFVEARPQAIEKLFCEALALPFNASVDNLSLSISKEQLVEFNARLEDAKQRYQRNGLPHRAAIFRQSLMDFLDKI